MKGLVPITMVLFIMGCSGGGNHQPSSSISQEEVNSFKSTTKYDESYIKKLAGNAQNLNLSTETMNRLVSDYEELNNDPELKRLSDLAFQKIFDKDFEGALSTINDALKKSPSNMFLLNKRGGALGGVQDYDGCINTLDTIVDYPPAIKGLAICYYGAGDYGKSQFYTYRGLEFFPDDVTLKIMKDKLDSN